MNANINLNRFVEGCSTAWQKTVKVSGDWMGRVIVIIKSGSERTQPYFQNQWWATISLVAVTLFLVEVGDVLGKKAKGMFSDDDTEEGEKVTFGQVVCAIATVGIGVCAFSKFVNLPFSGLAITGIAAATIVVRANFVKESSPL